MHDLQTTDHHQNLAQAAPTRTITACCSCTNCLAGSNGRLLDSISWGSLKLNTQSWEPRSHTSSVNPAQKVLNHTSSQNQRKIQGDTAYPGNEDTHPTAVGPTWPTNSRRNLRLVLPGWTIQDSCCRHECLHKLIQAPTINNFPASTAPTYAHQPVAAAVEQQPQSG